ncbi:MAG: YciI family protein [Acidimicrobiales bacterium]|jgi:hypothetical protein
MAEYLVLIYEDESAYASGEAYGQAMTDHSAFGDANAAALRGGNALHPTSAATSIRGFGTDSFTVTDGPFAETKEALGGYYIVEAADLDEAISLAKQVPARHGGVEVRPIMVFD